MNRPVVVLEGWSTVIVPALPPDGRVQPVHALLVRENVLMVSACAASATPATRPERSESFNNDFILLLCMRSIAF